MQPVPSAEQEPASNADVSHAAGRDDRQPGALPSTEDQAPEERVDPHAGWQLWRPSVLHGLLTWTIGLIVYGMLTLVGYMPFDRLGDSRIPEPRTVDDLLGRWLRWDTVWYVEIADRGYDFDERSTAFFPLYPQLIRLVNPVVPGRTLLAALAVSMLACLIALILVHRLTADLMGPQDARRTTLYLLAFPTGFYLMAGYNESLFVALTVGALYCMRRGRWWSAGLLAGVASGSRLAGVMLAAAFAFEYARQRGFSWRRITPDVLGLLLVPVGLIAYMGYNQWRFGDSLIFLRQQAAWFRTGFQPPWESVTVTLELIFGPEYGSFSLATIHNVANLSTLLLFLTVLGFATVGRWRLGVEHTYLVIFAALVLMMPLVNSIRSYYPLSSSWRFALECIVVFMFFGKLGRRQHFDRLYLSLMWALQGVMVISYLSETFVG